MVRYISNFIKVIAVALIATLAHAWEPTKPITAVIGFAPGSGNELSFRGIRSVYLAFNKNKIMPKNVHWLYFGDKNIIFKRLSIQLN